MVFTFWEQLIRNLIVVFRFILYLSIFSLCLPVAVKYIQLDFMAWIGCYLASNLNTSDDDDDIVLYVIY